MMHASAGRCPLWICWIGLAIATAVPSQAAPEPPPKAVFEQLDRLTAIDVTVEVARVKERWAAGEPRPGDFQILLDAQPRSLIGVAPVAPAGGWRTVIYFDIELASARTVRWAAETLAQQATRLTERGRVEVVVADPLPRQLLQPTRDPQALRAVLNQLALHPPGREVLLRLRSEVLQELHRGATELAPAELMVWASGEEVLRVRWQQDRLLAWLLDVGSEDERALFWITDGYDLRPADFYASQIDSEVAAAHQTSLVAASSELARTVASYGWLTFPLKAPAPQLALPGKRIGKWRLQGLTAAREADRDPDLAAAYLELGEALQVQGKLEDAERAYRKALHHYYRDPRTADRQAAALAGLGRVLLALGQDASARRAFRQALDLDPQVVLQAGIPAPILISPTAPLEELAQASGGRLLRQAGAVAEAIDSWSRRLRLSYQVAGDPDGRLWPLKVLGPGEELLVGPAWGRFSTPLTVAEARLRLAPSTIDAAGLLPLRVDLSLPVSAGAPAKLQVALAEGAADLLSGGALLRTSWGVGVEERLLRSEHRIPESPPVSDLNAWRDHFEVESADAEGWVAVLVEDLLSGLWRVEMVPLRPEFQLDDIAAER